MQTPYQFVLVSDNPEKEAAFRRKRQRHGSFYAFHGSAICTMPFSPLCSSFLVILSRQLAFHLQRRLKKLQ